MENLEAMSPIINGVSGGFNVCKVLPSSQIDGFVIDGKISVVKPETMKDAEDRFRSAAKFNIMKLFLYGRA